MSTEPRCEGCSLRPSLCLCALAPHVRTRTRTVVVMHQLERRKSTNTGRLAVLCVDNARLIFHDDDAALDAVITTGTPVVLFPVAGAQPIDDFRGAAAVTLIALDANWRQAARMRKRFAARGVPFAKAPPGPSSYALRKGPHDDGMSTFEAVARSLSVLEPGVDTAALLRALDVFQDRILWLRGVKKRDAVAGGIPDGVERHSA